jgi:valyl-tRNA synthetase
LSRTVSSVTSLMEDYQFGEAYRQVYEFMWGEFCDWYIEIAKIRLRSNDKVTLPVPILFHVLETSLRLLHPYMPFITEELWQNLRNYLSPEWQTTDSIIVAAYPEAEEAAIDPQAERVMASVIEIIRSIRNVRAQYNVESARWIEAQIYAGELKSAITPYSQAIQTLAKVRPVICDERQGQSQENALALVLKETEVVIPMASMVNLEAEKKRLKGEIEQIQAEVNRFETRLKDQAFLTKAPTAVVDKERAKLEAKKDKMGRLKQYLNQLHA